MAASVLTLGLRTHAGTMAVQAPPDLARLVGRFFAPLLERPPADAQPIVLEQRSSGLLAGADRRAGLAEPRPAPDMLVDLARHVLGEPGAVASPQLAIFAATVAWEQQQILLVSRPTGGKTSLAAWLVEQGFSYSGDGVAILDATRRSVAGLPGPLLFHADSTAHLGDLETVRHAPSLVGNNLLAVAPAPDWSAAGSAGPLKLIIDVTHRDGESLDLQALEPEQAVDCLAGSLLPEPDAAAAREILRSLVADVPVVALRYSAYGELRDVLDHLVRAIVTEELAPAAVSRLLAGLRGSAVAPRGSTFPIPAPSPRRTRRKLTISMATYDDYDGVFFSIQAIRMFHPEVEADVDFLVLDNHPDGPCSAALKKLENHVPGYRYVPVADARGTWTKFRAFDETDSDSVLGIDSHVFIYRGAIARLIAHLDAEPQCRDFLQGPLLSDDLTRLATHLEPRWRGGFYGTWEFRADDIEIDSPPFEIPMQGLGLFACRRGAWPGVNPRFSGFGGEEGYIQEKFRQRGGRTLCLPYLRWLHRFERPMGIPFPNTWEDRVRNYLIGHAELGLPLDPVRAHFTELLGEDFMRRFDATLKL